jgi:hypothetical protein
MASRGWSRVARLAAVGLVIAVSASLTAVAGASDARSAYFAGLGFDGCSAPSIGDLEGWSSSPFRALNIYIGGVNRACSQPKLNAAWVTTVTHLGWSLIPTYVGLQAPTSGCKCSRITPSVAYAQGVLASQGAVSDAAALGIGSGNPIYDDMEAYTVDSANTTAVLSFLEGWINGLAAKGYESGVYGAAKSGIANLVATVGTGYTEPDDIWIADWNGKDTTDDPSVPNSLWSQHQRIHQYLGPHDEKYGRVVLDIDADDCDGAVVTAATLGSRA